MDDVKNQFKGLVKKLNNPFASSSARFKGEGHKLGGGQESTQQKPDSQQHPLSQHQGDWRKLQQERWDRERSPHPTPRQDRSQPSVASSTQSQPFKLPISNDNTAHVPANMSDASIMQPKFNGSSEAGICDVLRDQKLDHTHISCAAILQHDCGSDPSVHCSEALAAQKHEDVLPSSRDCMKSSMDNGLDSQNCLDRNERLSESVGSGQNEKTAAFDQVSSHIGSISSSANCDGLQVFQCPVCGSWWRSETEVNDHVDACLSQNASTPSEDMLYSATKSHEDQTKVALGVFLSGGPSRETMDVFVRIFRNILNSPDLEKFRKIRLSNPKIHDTVGMALGGVELLEAVGFDYQTEQDEIWAVMGAPSVSQVKALQAVISELEACTHGPPKEEVNLKQKPPVRRKVDRQARVFYAAPEKLAAKMELPDSFFQLSAAELRQEAAERKKKLDDSQLLISKTSREKMAAANKRKYKAAIIRVQFPDGVVLQGMFLPWESTTAIYEFVSTSLRNPNTQFSLAAPGLSKKKIIQALASDGTTKLPTLEEADLVPAVLLKFQCAESDSSTFTGLHPDVLARIEPLSSTSLGFQ